MHAFFRLCRGVAAFGLFGLAAVQAQTASRIAGAIDASQQSMLQGSRHPLPAGAAATGRLEGATPLPGMTLRFSMTAAQQADLTMLLAQQQNPTSAQYHRWLTPEQFAARFGVSDADLAKTTAWLEQQGFTVQGPNQSRTQIVFSGTAAQAEQAFSTELDRYTVAGESVFAASRDLSLPSALAAVVGSVGNLSSIRPRPHHRVPTSGYVSGHFTSSSSGFHFLAPDDFTTIYDVKALYNAGYTGTGHTIAVVGQTAIATTDIAAFRSAAGLPASTPTFTQVPNSGTSIDVGGDDENESDLDVEWAGGIAQNATINFIYVGNAQNLSVFDSLQYAIVHNVAPVISISYGACENSFGSANANALQTLLQEANAQGQTVISASGDSGAADCDFSTATTLVSFATQGLAVDLPAASPNVTGVGGTEFTGDVSTPSTYWSSSNNASNGSALLYIPEEGWNDTSTTNGLDGTGGGKSMFFGKPSWQTGTGVPNDSARDVPDIAFNASPQHDGYLYCSQGSCSNGFRDAQNNLTVAGGTSFGAPTFAAVLTLIEQETGSSGLGNVNADLYSIAAKTPSAFHDITTGNNIVACTAGSTGCGSSGQIGYSAGAGYDQVTGLGTVDANALATAFAGLSGGGGGTPLAPTTTALVSSATTPAANQSITFTATITPNSVSGTPTGSVQFAVDGANSGSAVAVTSSAASFTTSFTTAGSHTVTATYSGDTAFAGSSASLAVNVATTAGFTLAASNLTVSQGSTGTSTITVTPANGYTGTVSFAVSSATAVSNLCAISVGSAMVSSATPATATLTIGTSASTCVTTGARHGLAMTTSAPASGSRMTFAYAGLLPLFCLAGLGRRRRAWRLAALSLCMLSGALWLSGCGSNSSSANAAPKGAYTLTVTGTDNTAHLTSSTTFTLTID